MYSWKKLKEKWFPLKNNWLPEGWRGSESEEWYFERLGYNSPETQKVSLRYLRGEGWLMTIVIIQ